MSSTSSSSQLDQREFDANNNKNENSDRKQKLAKKHFLLHEIEEAMTMSSTNLRVLTATRETSYRLWDRCIRTCIGNMHKTLRDIRRQGATKLCKKYYDEVALETRRYHRLTHARGKILGSTNIEEIEKLHNDYGRTILSKNRVCLTPKVIFDEQALFKFAEKMSIEIEMPIVDDLQLPPFVDFPQFAPVYYATVDQTKFVLPYIICSRDERGPELMAHILAPMRSDRNMNIVKPCRDKWSFAISIFGVSWARVAVRVYDRHPDCDTPQDNVLVLFLDDHRKHACWNNQFANFYEIPKDYNFKRIPAFTFHVWLCDVDYRWATYGSQARIPLAERKVKVKQFIKDFKEYEGHEPHCCVKLTGQRGLEPWSFNGDILIGISKTAAMSKDQNDLRGHSMRYIFRPIFNMMGAEENVAYTGREIYEEERIETIETLRPAELPPNPVYDENNKYIGFEGEELEVIGDNDPVAAKNDLEASLDEFDREFENELEDPELDLSDIEDDVGIEMMVESMEEYAGQVRDSFSDSSCGETVMEAYSDKEEEATVEEAIVSASPVDEAGDRPIDNNNDRPNMTKSGADSEENPESQKTENTSSVEAPQENADDRLIVGEKRKRAVNQKLPAKNTLNSEIGTPPLSKKRFKWLKKKSNYKIRCKGKSAKKDLYTSLRRAHDFLDEPPKMNIRVRKSSLGMSGDSDVSDHEDPEQSVWFYKMTEFDRWGNADMLKDQQIQLENNDDIVHIDSFNQKEAFEAETEKTSGEFSGEKFQALVEENEEVYQKFYDYFFGAEEPSQNKMMDHQKRFKAERLLWDVNGTKKLRENLLNIEKINHPEFLIFWEAFEMPCSYGQAFRRQSEHRHQHVLNLGTEPEDGEKGWREKSFNKVPLKVPDKKLKENVPVPDKWKTIETWEFSRYLLDRKRKKLERKAQKKRLEKEQEAQARVEAAKKAKEAQENAKEIEKEAQNPRKDPQPAQKRDIPSNKKKPFASPPQPLSARDANVNKQAAIKDPNCQNWRANRLVEASNEPLPQEKKSGKPYYPPQNPSPSKQVNYQNKQEKKYGQNSVSRNGSRPEFGPADEQERAPPYQTPQKASRSRSREFVDKRNWRREQEEEDYSKQESKENYNPKYRNNDSSDERRPRNQTGRAEFITMEQLKDYHTIPVPTYQGSAVPIALPPRPSNQPIRKSDLLREQKQAVQAQNQQIKAKKPTWGDSETSPEMVAQQRASLRSSLKQSSGLNRQDSRGSSSRVRFRENPRDYRSPSPEYNYRGGYNQNRSRTPSPVRQQQQQYYKELPTRGGPHARGGYGGRVSRPMNTNYDQNHNRIVNDNLSSDESEKHPYGSLRNEYRDRRGFKPSHNFKSRGNGNSNNGYFKNHHWNNRGGNNSNYGSGYNNKRGGYRNNSNRNNNFEESNYGRKERFTGNNGYSKRSDYGFGDRCIDFNKRQEFQEQPRYHGDRRTSTESHFEKGCGVAGWNANEAQIQKPLAPKIQNQENAFQLPTWDSKSPAPSKPYILRARNLDKWNSSEIKGLFQVFNPKKVKKDGDDWLIAFRTQADMDGARIVDGESLPSKNGSKKIIIMKENI